MGSAQTRFKLKRHIKPPPAQAIQFMTVEQKSPPPTSTGPVTPPSTGPVEEKHTPPQKSTGNIPISPEKEPLLPVVNYVRGQLPSRAKQEMNAFEKGTLQIGDYILVVKRENGELVLSTAEPLTGSVAVKVTMFTNLYRDVTRHATWLSGDGVTTKTVYKCFIYARIERSQVVRKTDCDSIIELTGHALQIYLEYYKRMAKMLKQKPGPVLKSPSKGK